MGTPTTISTGELAPGQVKLWEGHVFLNAVVIQPGATVTIYDNISASGKIVFLYVNAGTDTASVVFRNAVRCDIGMFLDVVAANANIYYGAT